MSPVDFEDNSLAAMEVAAQIARQTDGTVLVFHVISMMIAAPMGRPVYINVYQSQEEATKEELRKIGAQRLRGIKYEVLTHLGDPASTIIRTAKHTAADLIVMATHGRRGLSRVMLGSVAEMVLREAPCPVLCVRRGGPDRTRVAGWMSSSPVTATPDEKLSSVQARMREGNFRCAPVLDNGRLAGIVTDHGVSRAGDINEVEVKSAMNKDPMTVTPNTPLREAARTLFEQKVDALPVVEDGRLVGVMTTSDIIRAFLAED